MLGSPGPFSTPELTTILPIFNVPSAIAGTWDRSSNEAAIAEPLKRFIVFTLR